MRGVLYKWFMYGTEGIMSEGVLSGMHVIITYME